MSFKEIEELKETREYKAAQTMEDAVNSCSWDEETFAKAFTMWHRTLQQKFFSTMISVIKTAASDDYMYDGRNEYTHQLARRIVDTGVLDSVYLPTI